MTADKYNHIPFEISVKRQIKSPEYVKVNQVAKLSKGQPKSQVLN